jgi:hypothetical protein
MAHTLIERFWLQPLVMPAKAGIQRMSGFPWMRAKLRLILGDDRQQKIPLQDLAHN